MSDPTFTIAEDGLSITCRKCFKTSYNLNDVRHHYCGHCNYFHDVGDEPHTSIEVDLTKMVNSFAEFLKNRHPECQVAVIIFNPPTKEGGHLGVSIATNADQRFIGDAFRHYADLIEAGKLGDQLWTPDK